MDDGRTTAVEIRTDLLEALRELYRDRSDREILEGLARAYLLRRDVRATQETSGLSEQEAERIAYEELAAVRQEQAPANSAADVPGERQ
jgi:hypothetical protein